MSNDLEQRLQAALDTEGLTDDLLSEVSGQPEFDGIVELDAALRTLPRAEFDFSDVVLARLDEDLEEIPGLLDAPHFDVDSAQVVSEQRAPAEETPRVENAPVSLDDARRKRSGTPFLLAAAAVIGLVGTGTLMTLNSPAGEMVAMEASAVTSPESPALSAAPASQAAAESEAYPSEVMAAPEEPEAEEASEADRDFGALALNDEVRAEPAAQARGAMPATPRRARLGSAGEAAPRGGVGDTLNATQRRTLARIESCLPDHIRVTRVRETSNGAGVAGVETSEPLSEEVDDCIAGVLDTFPQARRRRRRPAAARMSASMSVSMSTAMTNSTWGADP